MTEKRFTMCHQQNDLNGWTMSIVDWETDEPFNYTQYEVHSESITDTKDEMEDLCLLLNQMNEENEQLKSTLIELIEIGDYQQGRIKELNQDSITSYKHYKKLLNENEGLKSSNMEYEDALARLEEENKELKEAMKRMMIDMMDGG